MKSCLVDGCCGRHYAKNLCHAHYQRMSKNGHLSLSRRRNGTGTIADGRLRFWHEGKLKHRYIMVVERALGKEIPKKSVVHHVDDNPLNDDPSNLVLCPDQAYHMLLHKRSRALEESGHVDWLKCPYCKKYDDSINLKCNGRWHYHRFCATEYQRMRKAL